MYACIENKIHDRCFQKPIALDRLRGSNYMLLLLSYLFWISHRNKCIRDL